MYQISCSRLRKTTTTKMLNEIKTQVICKITFENVCSALRHHFETFPKSHFELTQLIQLVLKKKEVLDQQALPASRMTQTDTSREPQETSG